MKKTLPEFYYLTHFHEFLQTIGEHFAHLLRESDQAFIREFQVAQQAEQAIIVRIINRSQPWVRRETLNYPEIPTWQQALAALENKHWIGTATTLINTNNLKSFLRVLTKSDLQRVYSDADAAIALQIRKSASKQHWLDACSQLHHVTVRNLSIAKTFVALHSDLETTIRYLLFIYFGRMETDFKQFSLRDLGIRTTHEQAIVTNESSPRYVSIAEAESAFYYSELRRLLADGISEPFEVDAIEDWPAPIGHHAERLAASCRFYYGDALKVTNPQRACAIWRETLHPKAQEQAVRLLFQCGNHAAAIELAKAIIDDPLDDSLALFAEDFVARKVGGKRTSILTDLLRNSLPEVAIDEAYRGAVERGVMAWHERHGRRCFHSENNMWRALFVIFFWPELIDSKEGGFVSEFDRTPRLLQANSFYSLMTAAIERRLSLFADKRSATLHIQQQVTRHYGTPVGLFQWHPDLLQQLLALLQAPSQALQSHLRAMSRDYFAFTDGYPDLLVLDNRSLYFEEVKAPGDQLRRNQARMLQHLHAIGIDADIRPIRWHIDVHQPYVVIDVETTGGGKDYHRITEIAVVRIEQGKLVDQWTQLVNPQRKIPYAITELTGISNEMVATAPLFAEIADEFMRRCEGAIFVAHNVNFDYGFIRREFDRMGQRFRMPKLCTVQLARKHLASLSSYRLRALCEAYDIELVEHHRALADARATAELFLLIQSRRQEFQTVQ